MTDYAATYRDTRRGLTDLTAGLDDATLASAVPATPDWAIRDVVAHVIGIVSDLLAGNLTGVGTDEWTAAQVDPRRLLPFTAVLAEWGEQGPAIEAQLATWPPEFAEPLLSDLAVHDLDVRGALDRRDARDTPAVAVAFEHYAQTLGDRIDDAGVGALRLQPDDAATVVAGTGDPDVTVRASRFELLRACTGRRSAEQVRRYEWDGDPDRVLAFLAAYPMRETPLHE